jgi:DNA/RNA-binding domain of Phe-tRNA-synthetase-like protein
LPAKKRLGKFLTAAKVPRQSRENALIVADSEKIIWVWPVRISECAKVTSNTSQILQLHIYPVR